MGDAAEPESVEHPLWARFLRWCTIHPEDPPADDNFLVRVAHDPSPRLTGLPDYEYTPLANPDADARIVELLPGKFDDDVKVRIHHVTLKHPDRPGDWREELKEVRDNLPEGWEVFKTVS